MRVRPLGERAVAGDVAVVDGLPDVLELAPFDGGFVEGDERAHA